MGNDRHGCFLAGVTVSAAIPGSVPSAIEKTEVYTNVKAVETHRPVHVELYSKQCVPVLSP
jgi:hypothetical protein